MALLGLGGKGLRERLIRQYNILPPGSTGQTLFDEIIPVVLVDDLTSGLILDESYRAPAISAPTQAAVALENGFCSITAPSGSMLLVERVEFRFGTAGPGAVNIGPTDTPTPAVAFWRDRRIRGSPQANVAIGSRVGLTGTTIANIRVTTVFTSLDLGIILSPSTDSLESTLAIWNTTVNDAVNVNWYWREILIP